MTLAERLKAARESIGYTQREMAKAINSNSVQTWQVYEAGSSIPGGKVLEALSRMGFSVDWLLTGTGTMKRDDNIIYERVRLIVEVFHEFLIDRGWTPPPDVIAKHVADIFKVANEREELGWDKDKIRQYYDPKYKEHSND